MARRRYRPRRFYHSRRPRWREGPDQGPRPRVGRFCTYCGKNAGNLPYVCNYCGSLFCVDHRLPENHECSGLEKAKIISDKRFDSKSYSELSTYNDTGYRGTLPTESSRGQRRFSFVSKLKRKSAIILIVILVMAGIWAGLYLSAPVSQAQAYQQFLTWGLLFFAITFMFGIVAATPPKRKPRVRIRDMEVDDGAEVIIRTNQPPRKPVSRRLAKWVLLMGAVIALFGFAYGIASVELGYVSVSLGGFALGIGVALIARLR